MTIVLPYPPATLNPNNRSCWQKKARKARTYGAACHWSLLGASSTIGGCAAFRITFRPPDSRRRDLDNAISSFKAGQDALARIVGIDDSRLSITFAPMGAPLPPHGAVEVEPV